LRDLYFLFNLLSSLDEERSKEIKPRRSACPPLDFHESLQKVASRPSGSPLAKIARRAISSLVRARDCYGNQFTTELLRAAAGSRAGLLTLSATEQYLTPSSGSEVNRFFKHQ
jgi:hypothetical protein